MPLSDDVRMIFSAQNMAGPEIERLVATLDAFDQGAGVATEAFAQLEAGAARQAQTLLSLDSAYGRVVASSEAMRSVQEQITTGLLSGTAAADAQAAAMGRLEAATASYLGAGQRAAAAAADPRINPVGGVGRAGYGPEYVPGMLVAPFDLIDLNNPATYPEGTRVLTPGEQAMYNARAASARAQSTIADLQQLGIDTTPITSGRGVGVAGAAGAGGAAAEGGLLAGIGGEVGAAVKYSALYGGLYAGASAMASGVGSAADLSRTEGMIAGQTNLTQAQVADLAGRMQAEVARGGIPYSPTQELQGSYALASVGLGGGNVAVIDAVNQLTTRMSAASMAPDTSTANQAMLALLQATGGLQGPDVLQRATTLANQLQTGVNISPLQFSDFASQLPKFVGAGGQLGIQSADLIGYLSLAAQAQITPDEAGNEATALQQSLVHPNRRAQNILGGMGINVHDPRGVLGQLGGLVPFLERVQEATIGQGATQAQTMDALVGLTGNVVAARGLTTVLTQNPNIGATFAQFQQPGNAVDRAYSTYEATPGAQLQSAQTQFAAALTTLGTTVLPAFTQAVQGATTVLAAASDVLKNPGVSISNAWQVFMERNNPFSAAGGDLDRSKMQVAINLQHAEHIERMPAEQQAFIFGQAQGLSGPDLQAYIAQYLGTPRNLEAAFAQENAAVRGLSGQKQQDYLHQYVWGPGGPGEQYYGTAQQQRYTAQITALGETGGLNEVRMLEERGVNIPQYIATLRQAQAWTDAQTHARQSAEAVGQPAAVAALITMTGGLRAEGTQGSASAQFATPAQLAAMSLAPPSGGAGSTPAGQQERDLQAQLRTAELQGNLGLSSQLAQTLIAFERTNQQQLGLSSAQLGLNVEQIQHGLSRVGGATIRDATGPTLIRPADTGFTDPRAAYGQALARIAGDEGERRQLQILEQQLAAAHKTVEQQAKQIQDDGQIITALKAIARNTSPRASDMTRPIPRNVSGGHPSL